VGSAASASVFLIDSSPNNRSLCLTIEDDDKFGTNVRFSSDGGEIIVSGYRVYSFKVSFLFGLGSGGLRTCLSKSNLPPSFFPSRFAFAGEDWRDVSEGAGTQISVSDASVNILLQTMTSSRDPDKFSRRYVLQNTPGQEFEFTNNAASLRACAPGSFNPDASFAPCRPCLSGSYQSISGSRSCVSKFIFLSFTPSDRQRFS
jgi:hypothetical protein